MAALAVLKGPSTRPSFTARSAASNRFSSSTLSTTTCGRNRMPPFVAVASTKSPTLRPTALRVASGIVTWNLGFTRVRAIVVKSYSPTVALPRTASSKFGGVRPARCGADVRLIGFTPDDNPSCAPSAAPRDGRRGAAERSCSGPLRHTTLLARRDARYHDGMLRLPTARPRLTHSDAFSLAKVYHTISYAAFHA